MLIETPRTVREDVRYPESSKTSFRWSNHSAEWHFKLASGRYGHAGFRFWRPHNLAPARDRYELIFKMTPAHMANHLWVGLADGDDHPDRVLVDLPLSRYVPNTKARKPIEVRIPLRDFPGTGHVLHGGQDASNESLREMEFDWEDVSEIRIINNGGRLPDREVIITELRFQR